MSEPFEDDDLMEVANVSKSQGGDKPDIEVDKGADRDDAVEDNLVPVVAPHEVSLIMMIMMTMMIPDDDDDDDYHNDGDDDVEDDDALFWASSVSL